MRSRDKLTAVDLFSGCGGLTRGLRDAGYNVLGAVELDPFAARVYARNHLRTTLFRSDIRRLAARTVMDSLRLKPGELDLLAGCPPCQGFSTLTTRNGHRDVHDRRNDLLNDVLRFVRRLRPHAIMIENVPSLAYQEVFERFCENLVRMDYHLEWKIVDVARYAVPQRRRRLVLMASKNARPTLAPELPVIVTVRDAIGALPSPGDSGDPLHDLPERRSAKVSRLIRLIPPDGGSRGDLPREEQLRCHQRITGFHDVYGRMKWDDVAPTITSGCFNPSKGRFLHPVENRCITLREASLLQTFPENYRFDPSAGKERTALMIGNALPPRFIALHARALAKLTRRQRKDHG